MKQSTEGEENLLDRTVIFYASNLGNASSHDNNNLPIILAGGGFKHQGHVAFDRTNNTLLSNLFVRMLHQMDIEAESFGASKGADALQAGAEQAESLAKALRAMTRPSGEPLGLEAFVLHTRTGSVVTVGQFDDLNDPELHRVRKELQSIKMNVTEDRQGFKPAVNAQSIFGNLIPMPIPKP